MRCGFWERRWQSTMRTNSARWFRKAFRSLLTERKSWLCCARLIPACPKAGVEALVSRAERTGKNLFFGAGWILAEDSAIEEAEYCPLKAGAAFLSAADYPFVAECLRREILRRLIRHGVIVENTSGVYVDATSFVESGAVLSHDVTVSGKSLVKSGARIYPYTVVEDRHGHAFCGSGAVCASVQTNPVKAVAPKRAGARGRPPVGGK